MRNLSIWSDIEERTTASSLDFIHLFIYLFVRLSFYLRKKADTSVPITILFEIRWRQKRRKNGLDVACISSTI